MRPFGKNQTSCFGLLVILLLIFSPAGAQTFSGLPGITLQGSLAEKLKTIEASNRLGKVECYADDTVLLKRISEKSIWISELEIIGRTGSTDGGLKRLKKLPPISSLALYGISFPAIHGVLVNVPGDSLFSLKLANCSLDSVDACIAIFKNLRILNLLGNKLVKWPDAINQLPALTELELSENFLQECRPVNSHLRKLRMRDNRIGKSPIHLAYVKELVQIDLSQNRIEVLPADIGENCPLLENIKVDNNQLQDFPPSLSHCVALHWIDAYKNNIVVFPDVFLQLKTLWVLNVGYNRLNALPENICGLKSLQRLNISGNFLETLPDGLYAMPALHELHTEGNVFTKTPLVISLIIEENTEPQLKPGETEAAFPRMLLTQNIIFSDKATYHPLQNKFYNSDSLVLEVNNHFTEDFRFFGYTKKIILNGIKDSVWPSAVMQCYTMAEEVTIRNSTIDTAVLSQCVSVQQNLKKIAIQNSGMSTLPESIQWPKTLIEIDLGGNSLEALPEAFCKLSALKYVDVPGNRLKIIPECLIGKLRF